MFLANLKTVDMFLEAKVRTGRIVDMFLTAILRTGTKEVKKRLFVRLWNKERLQENGAVYEPFQDLYFSCHIDVSDLAGAAASCIVKEGLAEYLGVDRKQLVADAVDNGTKIRPALTMPIEAFMSRLGAPVEAEPENNLMIATTEDFLYGASVIMYPGFLERISGGKNLYPAPPIRP